MGTRFDRTGRGRRAIAGGLLCAFTLALGACAAHYRVTDPQTGDTYLTKDLEERRGGLRFTDANTGETVRLDSYRFQKISKDEFESERSGGG
jgi:hypothetical protein